MRYLKAIVDLFRGTFERWAQDRGHLMAAALSYFMIFAIAPLIIVTINIAGLVFGEAAVEGQLFTALADVVGAEAALFIQSLVENATEETAGRIAAIIGVALLLYGASNVFFQLKMALNVIWRIRPQPKNNVFHYLKMRGMALLMVLTLGFLFLLTFVLTFVLTTLDDYIIVLFPAVGRLAGFYQVVVVFPLMVVLLTLLFRLLPDARIAWRDVWLGAVVTALFLLVGIQVLSFVIGRFLSVAVYGAAGSFIVVLYFVYYSAQILFLGAEFTYVYANKYGSQVRPLPHTITWVYEKKGSPEEPFYAMPVYSTPPGGAAAPPTPARKLELRAAAGLAGTAVVLLLAFLLGRKSA